MPFLAPPAATEQDNLAGYLSMQLDAFHALAHGLSDAQAAAAPSASDFSIGSLIRHVTVVTANWVDGVTHAPEHAPTEEIYRRVAEFERGFVAGDSLATALKEYDEVCDRALAAARSTDLDTHVPVPDAPWFPQDVEHWSVRWVWGHLIQELARHAGHGDIIRETLDGGTMYPLIAAAEGMGDLGFLQPWTPSEPGFTTGISTVVYFAADPAAARAWYTELLGAEPYYDQGPYVEWRVGPHDRELGLLDAAFAPEHRADGTGSVIAYWQVDDTAAAYERLLAMGATSQWPPRDFGAGYLGASVVDPFGNVLGVMQRPLG